MEEFRIPDNVFTVIKEPNKEPKSTKDYRLQNELLIKIRYLHTFCDGVKLGNWHNGNTDLPYILAGSVIEFGGRLFEAKKDIILKDGRANEFIDFRYICLDLIRYIDSNTEYIESDNDYLTVSIKQGGGGSTDLPKYDEEYRGFYYVSYVGTTIENLKTYASEKYLRLSFQFSDGKYIKKRLWDINDIDREGGELKRITKYYNSPGVHSFVCPPEAEGDFTIHICGGGGGGAGLGNNITDTSTNGEKSEILIAGRVITSCGGGERGIDGNLSLGPGGNGGTASGVGQLFTGGKGRDGINKVVVLGGKITGNTLIPTPYGNGGNSGAWSVGGNGGGGGAGAVAIVTITQEMLGSAKQITIVIGNGGRATVKNNNTAITIPTVGIGGYCVIEYYTR